MTDALEKLLKNPRIWRGQVQVNSPDSEDGLTSGYPKLDQCLPGGGWPQHALTEILLEYYGTGELKLLMPALARLSQPQDGDVEAGWIAWIAPPFEPYPPALRQWGVNLSRVLIVRPGKRQRSYGQQNKPCPREIVPRFCCGRMHWTTQPAVVCSLLRKKGKAGPLLFVH